MHGCRCLGGFTYFSVFGRVWDMSDCNKREQQKIITQ